MAVQKDGHAVTASSYFLLYVLHYFVARVLFDSLRGAGVSELLLLGGAVFALAYLWRVRRHRSTSS